MIKYRLFAISLIALSTSYVGLAGCGAPAAVDPASLGERVQEFTNAGAPFLNTSTTRDGSSDWDACHGKASCAAGETVSGLSVMPNGAARTALCKSTDPSVFSGNTVATLTLDAGADQRRASRLGDWALNYWKLECGSGEYVSGVSENIFSCQGNNRFHAVRCATGTGLSDSCNVRTFDGADDRGSLSSGDWDYGAYKGECSDSEYVAGVSINPSTGRPHSLLCCAAQVCPTGKTLLDGNTCVTLTPWGNQTLIPDGSKIAIRLRTAMLSYSGGSVSWPKWVGLSSSDNVTLDAVDTDLKSRDLFTVSLFWPAGETSFDMPWYNMLAANGSYVDWRSKPNTLMANKSANDASIFVRGSTASTAPDFLLQQMTWGERQNLLDYLRQGRSFRTICKNAFSWGTEHITSWVNEWGCYDSGDVDYFVVTP